MTKDEILRMARKVGFTQIKAYNNVDVFISVDSEIERFAALVAAAEREVCAQVADKYAEGPERNYSELIAAAIRARGEKK